MPETARSPPDRAEGACGGAANRCYVEFARLAGTKKPPGRAAYGHTFLPRGISSTVAIRAAAQSITMDVKSGDENQAAYPMCVSELFSASISAWII